MSHTSIFQMAKVKNLHLFKEIAEQNGAEVVVGNDLKVQAYNVLSNNAVCSFKLPSWRYSIAINKDGQILYDSYGSGPGSMARLGRLIQDYNFAAIVEAIESNSDVSSYSVNKHENGDIEMVLEYE